MFGHRSPFVKCRISRDLFEQLWPPDEQVSGKAAGIKRFDEQFEQFRICHQQLEEQTAQAIGLDKPDELIERITACGTPDEVRAKVEEYNRNGCTCPVLYPLGDDVKLMIDTFAQM